MIRVLPLLAVLALAGCGVQPPSPVADPERAWEAHRARVETLDAWHIRGRLGLSTPEESWQADLVWVQQPEAFRIQLIAPLGQGSVLVQGGPAGAELRTSAEPRPVRAADAESLLYRHTGWRMPVESLRYWVCGLPAPGGAPRFVLDAYGRLQSLRQFGWEVRYRSYRDVGDMRLPEKIFLHRDGVDLRLVIRNWGAAG